MCLIFEIRYCALPVAVITSFCETLYTVGCKANDDCVHNILHAFIFLFPSVIMTSFRSPSQILIAATIIHSILLHPICFPIWYYPFVICVVLRRTVALKKSLSKRSFATLSEHGQRMVRARSKPGRRRLCTYQLGFNHPSEDFRSTQPFRRRSLTTKGPCRSNVASLWICDVQSGSKTEFSPSTSVLPCLFDPSYAHYPLVYHQRYITPVIPTSNLK